MIIIDTREQYKNVAERFFTEQGVTALISGLSADSYCDYILASGGKTLGVQRKTIAEVINQMQVMKKRIFDIFNFYDRVALIIEEDFMVDAKTGWVMLHNNDGYFCTQFHVTNYYSFLQSLRDDGVLVATTNGIDQSLWWLLSTHNRMSEEHVPRRILRYHTPQEEALGVIGLINGFGGVTAKKILGKYSIKELVNMDEDGLKEAGMNSTQRYSFVRTINTVLQSNN